MDLLDLAKKVKRGSRLLDRKLPSWRRVMQKHRDQFNFADPQFCVLGTLKHHLGRARVLRKQAGSSEAGYHGLLQALRLDRGSEHGFDWSGSVDDATGDTLALLWRTEFEQ